MEEEEEEEEEGRGMGGRRKLCIFESHACTHSSIKLVKNLIHLKLGAAAIFRAKQARLTTPYETRKNMVTIGAMVLSWPRNSVAW